MLASILYSFLINLKTFLHCPNHVFYWKNQQLFNFHLLLRNMNNHRSAFPFWHHFGSLLAYFFCVFSVSIFGPLFGCLFSDFWSKWFPKRSDQKALRTLLGTPRAQRRPEAPQMSYSPRPFSNRMSYGGPDAPKMHPGPSRVLVLEHF